MIMAQMCNVKEEPIEEYNDKDIDSLTHYNTCQRIYNVTKIKIEEPARTQTECFSDEVHSSADKVEGDKGR